MGSLKKFKRFLTELFGNPRVLQVFFGEQSKVVQKTENYDEKKVYDKINSVFASRFERNIDIDQLQQTPPPIPNPPLHPKPSPPSQTPPPPPIPNPPPPPSRHHQFHSPIPPPWSTHPRFYYCSLFLTLISSQKLRSP